MSRKRILVVDDNLVVLKSMAMKLTAEGYDVVTAEDGGAAVSAVRQEKPDLILLDLSFPPDVGHGGGVAWDGFLIMAWLRRLEEGKNVPIIVITGGDPAKYKDQALAAGAVSFFHKPINNDELLAVIAQSAWFLPQLFTANAVERLSRKKPVVVNLGLFLERMPISASSCASQSIAFCTNTRFSGEFRT